MWITKVKNEENVQMQLMGILSLRHSFIHLHLVAFNFILIKALWLYNLLPCHLTCLLVDIRSKLNYCPKIFPRLWTCSMLLYNSHYTIILIVLRTFVGICRQNPRLSVKRSLATLAVKRSMSAMVLALYL